MINNDELNISNEKKELEKYLVGLADKANCYYHLYIIDYNYNSNISTYTIIPLIIISTFTGTATIFQPYVNPDNETIYLIIIGCCNIIGGLLTLLKEYFRILNMEQNKSYVAIPFQQLNREIRLHLALVENEREENTKDFSIKCRNQFDRMMETFPSVSKYAIEKFKKKYEEPIKSNESIKSIFNDNSGFNNENL